MVCRARSCSAGRGARVRDAILSRRQGDALPLGSARRRGAGRTSCRRLVCVAAGLLLLCGARAEPAAAAGVPAGFPRVRALLINGGGERARNFQSHLLHVQELVRLLVRNGVAAHDIVVFASDGDNPSPDLAVRDMETEPDFWLIEDVWPGTLLGNRVRYENTSVDGVLHRPAKKKALRQWIERQRSGFRAGDILLVYVTDHGSKNKADLANNGIVLWGEELSVNELRELLALLPETVRVVMVMSQCFSGSFAHLMSAEPGATTPSGNICGYFSAPADRFAYGCYPENLGKAQVGHGFRFIDALGDLGSLPRAHASVLVTDDTPDVPHRTSDVYLEGVLRREAERRGSTIDAVVDGLLRDAWRDTARFRMDIELLDRMADTFGGARPRSLADLDQQSDVIRGLRHRLRTYTPRWRTALLDLKRENVERFVAERPNWRERLDPEALQDINSRQKATFSEYFLEGLVEFLEGDRVASRQLAVLQRRAEQSRAALYRMEVRLGVQLRMRALLVRIAGLVYLDQYGSGRERLAFDQVGRCENVSVRPEGGLRRRAAAGDLALSRPEKFPPLAADVELVDAVTPGWLGVGFREVDRVAAVDQSLAGGAVKVLTVHTRSPAELAGIEVGDIILGPPGAHFGDPYGIRSWSMLARPGATHRLEVLRGEQSLAVDVEMAHYPVDP